MGGAGTHADAASGWFRSWHCAGSGGEPGTLGHRLSSLAQVLLCLGGVALTMVLAGTLSVASPVRRALSIDPAKLLREQ